MDLKYNLPCYMIVSRIDTKLKMLNTSIVRAIRTLQNMNKEQLLERNINQNFLADIQEHTFNMFHTIIMNRFLIDQESPSLYYKFQDLTKSIKFLCKGIKYKLEITKLHKNRKRKKQVQMHIIDGRMLD